MEQVFFNVPLAKLEPVFKGWLKDVLKEIQPVETDTSKSLEKLLSVQEAAKFLNLTVPTIYSKVSKGELPVMKRSKRLYFSSIQLMEYIKEGSVKSNAEIEKAANEYLNNKKGGYNEKA